jgi:sialate O-acetylesterase
MIEEWRRDWYAGTSGGTDPNFPVGFVQIGPLSQAVGKDAPKSVPTFQIRLGQTAGYGYAPNPYLTNTFMASAFELGNPHGTECLAGCVHIFNKQAVAHRLALAARALVYNESNLVYSGPRIKTITLQGGGAAAALLVTYSGPGVEGGGLKLRSKYGFEVWCSVIRQRLCPQGAPAMNSATPRCMG